MKIVIAGAGEVGHYVAKMLSSENHDIILMDSDEERLKDIPAAYDLLTLTGSPTSIHDLKEAGVPKADLFVVDYAARKREHDRLHVGDQSRCKKDHLAHR